jgi:hypothetical protein
MRLLIALIVWTVAAFGAIEVSSVVASSIHTQSGGSSASGGGGGGSGDATTVAATDSDSLFRTANFTKALATARSHLGANAQIDVAAVYPGYLDLIVERNGSEVDFYVNTFGDVNQTNTGGSSGSDTLFPLSEIKPAVPASLSRRIAATGLVPASQLHYMVVEADPVSSKFTWLVYPQQGTGVEYFQSAGGTGPLFVLRSNSSTGPQPVTP